MSATLEVPTESPIRRLAGELQRQLETKRDVMADTRLVSFGYGGVDVQGVEAWADESKPPPIVLNVDMPDGAEAFELTQHAHGQVATHLGIPRPLYDRLAWGTTGKEPKPAHPDLLFGLANGLLSREPKTRMLRTMDGRVRAFLSNRYRPRDNWDLLDTAILPALAEHPGTVEFKECSLTETRMYVKIVLPDFERPVTPRVGDVIRGGVLIQNSEVGSGMLVVAPYTDRLICVNGMVHTDFGQASRHVGKRITDDDNDAWDLYSDETRRLDDAAFFAKVGDTVRGVMNERIFDGIVGQMRELAGMPISDAPAAVTILADKHSFTEGEKTSMLGALIEEGDVSAWGVVNSITRTAKGLDDADRRTELEKIAGRLVSEPEWALSLAA